MAKFTEKLWLHLRRVAVSSLVIASGIKGFGQIVDVFGSTFGPPIAIGGFVLAFCISVSIMKHGL